jgi:D-alanine-D-alanine ligase
VRKPIVAVLSGGTSRERDVSLRSGENVAAAASGLHPTVLFRVNNEALPAGLDPKRHVVLSTLHGTFGEDGGMQSLLDAAGFAYAGCDAASSACTMDKAATKAKAAGAGVRVADGVVFDSASAPSPEDLVAKLGPDIVIKPSNEGSSVGLALCSSAAEVAATLASLSPGRWLAERRIRGTELTVGILGGKALGVVEVAPKVGVYDYTNKYTKGNTEYFAPARISDEAGGLARRFAETVFSVCSCRDFARADFILPADGQPVFLEINTLPGMTDTSLLPLSARCVGLGYQALVGEMLAPALRRFSQP